VTLDSEPRPLGGDRRDHIISLLVEHGRLRVVDLAAQLGVTAMTIRRDLAALETEGSIIRVHGGATLVPDGPRIEPEAPAADLSPSGHFAMLVPGLDSYWPDIARGAEAAAQRLGIRVSLRRSGYDSPDERPALEHLAEAEDVLGLLVSPNMAGPHAGEVIDWLVGCALPWVLVEREASMGAHHQPAESVVSDHIWGAQLAVHHLHDLGHRRIGFVTTETSPTTLKLMTGWERAVRDLDLTDGCFKATIVAHYHPTFAAQAERLLDRVRAEATTALFVHSDREAMALAQHLEDRGLDVPGNASIIAYDDEIAALFNPPLTAVRPARWALGEAAVHLLWSRIEDPTRPIHRVMVNPQLSVRESTAPPSTP
jgi:DNA-binding LacI/PurR family transcriptional regulator